MKFHVNLTKKGSNKLYKRGQPSGLRQIAGDDVEMRRHFCPGAPVSPRGQDECSVANGNHPGRDSSAESIMRQIDGGCPSKAVPLLNRLIGSVVARSEAALSQQIAPLDVTPHFN